VQEGSFGKKSPTLIHPPSKCGRCVQHFHQHCKRIYSAEILFEDYCNIKYIRQIDQTHLLEEEEGISEIYQLDEDNQYEEELADKKVGYDISCDQIQEEDIQPHGQPVEEKENNSCLIQKLHRPPPPLIEEEIDLLLNSHVATPAYTNLEHPHNLEYLVDSVLFHEKEMVVMFNHPEKCLVFENDLDFDVKAVDDEQDNDDFEICFKIKLLIFQCKNLHDFILIFQYSINIVMMKRILKICCLMKFHQIIFIN
jgi:hypothetical protein